MSKSRHIIATLMCLCALLTTGCANKQQRGSQYIRNAGFVFGTQYNFIYKHDRDLSRDVLLRLAKYDASMSVYNDTSLLSELNRGTSVKADTDMLTVLRTAKKYYDLSNGAFDVTVEPLSRHWRFTRDLKGDTISVEAYEKILAGVDTVLPYVGLDKISIAPDGTVTKADKRMKINANALAEGYGIDLAAQVLEDNGVEDYMVEIGGEIHCKGKNRHGENWRIGIDSPIEGSTVFNRATKRIIAVTDCAVSTSGNYRQCYHVSDGRVMQHTINPKTGHPVTHSMQSVTVVGPNTMTTDALCTTIMVAGSDSALTIINRLDNTEAYIIYKDADGTEHEDMTEGFRKLLEQK